MHNVRDLVRRKGSRIFSVKPDASVLEALQLMGAQNIGAVLVMTGTQVNRMSDTDWLTARSCRRRQWC